MNSKCLAFHAKNFFYLHTVVKDNLSKLAVIVSLKTKEKFEKFDLFGKQLTMHIAASNPIAINSSEIKKEIMDKEQKLISEELKNSGKSEDIANKISLGKINKFKEENSLMSQDWVMEPKKKVKDIIEELKIDQRKFILLCWSENKIRKSIKVIQRENYNFNILRYIYTWL